MGKREPARSMRTRCISKQILEGLDEFDHVVTQTEEFPTTSFSPSKRPIQTSRVTWGPTLKNPRSAEPAKLEGSERKESLRIRTFIGSTELEFSWVRDEDGRELWVVDDGSQPKLAS